VNSTGDYEQKSDDIGSDDEEDSDSDDANMIEFGSEEEDNGNTNWQSATLNWKQDDGPEDISDRVEENIDDTLLSLLTDWKQGLDNIQNRLPQDFVGLKSDEASQNEVDELDIRAKE